MMELMMTYFCGVFSGIIALGVVMRLRTKKEWVVPEVYRDDPEINAWMVELYLEKIREKHPKYGKKRIDEMCNFDKFFTAQEAVDVGLADRILT